MVMLGQKNLVKQQKQVRVKLPLWRHTLSVCVCVCSALEPGGESQVAPVINGSG